MPEPAATPAATTPASSHASSSAQAHGGSAWPNVAPWERHYALAGHATILLWHVMVPLLPAWVMWLIKRRESAFIADHLIESLRFQVSLLIYAGVLALLGLPTCSVAWWVGGPAVYVLGVVGGVHACVAAHEGRVFRYPMTWRFF